MGDRSTIAIITGPRKRKDRVYLYGHYMGPDSIRHALVGLRSGRTDDAAYLARIIFSSMVKDDIDGETGYGIDTTRTLDEHPLIVIDARNGSRVRLEDDTNTALTTWVSKEQFLQAAEGINADKRGALNKLAQTLSAAE